MKVALYARVSSEKQDTDLSISAQLKSLREYASKDGHIVVREFVDEAETGRTTARPAFREMIRLARRNDKPFEKILVWKFSRFARSRQDSIFYKTMLKKAGVSVVSINEPFDDTPTGRLMEGLIESLDEFYSDNLGEDVTRGMRESAERGFYLSSKSPYGYRKVRVHDGNKERTKLEIEIDQAAIVKSSFDSILSGKGLIQIVQDLNSRGIPGPKGKGWSKTGLYTILTNEVYTGVNIWGRNSKRGFDPVRVENAFPPIIDRETFNRVQVIMKEKSPLKSHPRRISSPFLLSGIAHCGHCGKALIGRYARSGKFAYYACGTLDKKGSGSCPSKYINAGRFEAIVMEMIKKRILTKSNLLQLIKLSNEDISSTMSSYRDELDLLTKTSNDVNHRLERLYDAIETGKVNLDDLVPRIRDLRNRQEQIQSRRLEIETEISDRKVELVDMDYLVSYVDDFQDLLTDGTLTEKRTFIKSFVEKIEVTGNEAVLTYSMNGMLDRITLDKEGVLPTVRYSGR